MANPAYIDAATGVLTDGEAWVALQTQALGSNQATVTFTSPNDGSSTDWSQFMDLVLLSYVRSTRSGVQGGFICQLNANGSNYKIQYMEGRSTGSTVHAIYESNNGARLGAFPGNGSTSGIYGSSIMTLHDINSGKFKVTDTVGGCNMRGTGTANFISTLWLNQSAITSLVISESGGSGYASVMAGSRFDLFGVLPRMVS